MPFADPTTHVPITFRQSATDADNRLRLDLAAAYVQDQIVISRYFQVVAGVRFDHFDLKYHNNRDLSDLRRVDRLVSPRLGFIVKPVEQTLDLRKLQRFVLAQCRRPVRVADVVDRTGQAGEIPELRSGVKWDIRRNLSFTSAVYRLDRTNTRSVDPNDPAAIIQTGSQRSNGFEAGLNGSISRRWNVAGGYAFQDVYVTSATASAAAGKKAAQTPHHTFSIWNKYQMTRRLGAGLGIINRSDMFAAIDNTVVLPGFTRFDGAVFYSINENWRIQANAENLFNKNYITNADSNTNLSPGSPRALKIGLVARF